MKYLATSIFWHVALTACFIYLTQPVKNVLVSMNTVQAHLIISKPLAEQSRMPVTPAPHTTRLPDKNIRGKAKALVSSHKKNIQLLLHQLIASQQDILDSATRNQESGKVKVGFWLLPNGYLEKITVLSTSGFISIDKAALAAVENVGQVKTTLLKRPTYFTIEIQF